MQPARIESDVEYSILLPRFVHQSAKRESVEEGRVMVRDEVLLKSMSYNPAEESVPTTMVRDAEEDIEEEDVIITE